MTPQSPLAIAIEALTEARAVALAPWNGNRDLIAKIDAALVQLAAAPEGEADDAAAIDRVLELLSERADAENDFRWDKTIGSWVRALKEKPILTQKGQDHEG